MAAPGGDKPLPEEDLHNPYASSSKWRHQESSRFARHAGHAHPHDQDQGPAREPTATGTTDDLANFLNKSRIEPEGDSQAGGNFVPLAVAARHANEQEAAEHAVVDGGLAQAHNGETPDGREVVCGPLLNYRRMNEGRWHGSVLIVVKGGGLQVLYQPSLQLRRVGEASQLAAAVDNASAQSQTVQFESQRLYSDGRNTFWAFDISVPIESSETKYEYEIPDVRYSSEKKPRVNSFFVAAADESMRIMFHSCNGFSVGTDEDAWSGPALWNDVVRKHSAMPFHVMVGGGDQIYNDGIRVNGPLRDWTAIGNPKKRQEYPFPESLRAACDDYYLKNYIRWYNTAPFSTANGQIPQLNIWDDHDVSGAKPQAGFQLFP